MQRLDDPARRVVVLDRDRLAVLGDRVHRRPLALRDGDRAELIARRAVHRHVPAGGERVVRVHAEHAERRREAAHAARRVGGLREARAAVRGATAPALAQRRVGEDADDVVRHAVRNRQRGVLHHDRRGRAAGLHAEDQAQVGEAEVVLQGDAAHAADRRDARVDEQAVDLVLAQAGVLDRQPHRLGGEPRRIVAVYAAHLGNAEAGDGSFALQIAVNHGLPVCRRPPQRTQAIP